MNPNKQLLQQVFAALADGDGRPFVDAMADDVSWTIAGHSAWSRRWEGKRAVRNELLRPLFERFAGAYRSKAQRIIAEDDCVVVEARGNATTKAGSTYSNHYCYVFRFEGGLVREITEYMDTEHAQALLGAP
jgi:uncharacterized protein